MKAILNFFKNLFTKDDYKPVEPSIGVIEKVVYNTDTDQVGIMTCYNNGLGSYFYDGHELIYSNYHLTIIANQPHGFVELGEL